MGESEAVLLPRIVRGRLDRLEDTLWLAEAGGRVCGSAWLAIGGDNPPTAVMGLVRTDPACRGQGISGRIVGEAICHAESRGCGCILLGTHNPVARKIYQRQGFVGFGYNSMMWSSPVSGSAGIGLHVPSASAFEVRSAAWGDLPGIVAAYLTPQPQRLLDGLELLTMHDGVLEQERTVSVGLALLLRAERPGCGMWLLVNERNQVLAAASIVTGDASRERHLCLHVLRDWGRPLDELICAAADGVHSDGGREAALRCMVGARDDTSDRVLRRNGFKTRPTGVEDRVAGGGIEVRWYAR